MVADNLLNNHGESLSHQAITEAGWLVQVFKSPSGSWTQIMFSPDGGCMRFAISGSGWQAIKPVQGTAL